MDYKTLYNALDADMDIKADLLPMGEPLCAAHIAPFAFEKPKSVMFSDEVVEQTFEANRDDNRCEKVPMTFDPEDVSTFKCKGGGYMDDEGERLELMKNTIVNRKFKKLEESGRILPNRQVKQVRTEKYWLQPDPVAFVSTVLLLGGVDLIKNYPDEFLLDCVLFMMEIWEHLEKSGSSCTISYKEGVSISNRPGKKQRHIIQKKVEQITKHL